MTRSSRAAQVIGAAVVAVVAFLLLAVVVGLLAWAVSSVWGQVLG